MNEDKLIEILEAISAIRATMVKSEDIQSIKDGLTRIRSDFEAHLATEEILEKNQYSIMAEIRDDMKAYKMDTDKQIHDIQVHFDDRITSCNANVMTLLDRQYYDKNDVHTLTNDIVNEHTVKRRDEITSAVNASEKRIWGKVRVFSIGAAVVAGAIGALIGFFIKYGSVLLTLMQSKDG